MKRKLCLSTTDTDALSVLTSEKFVCPITHHICTSHLHTASPYYVDPLDCHGHFILVDTDLF